MKLFSLLFSLSLLAVGCGNRSDDVLLPVPLPDLSGLPEAAQAQIRELHAGADSLDAGLADSTRAERQGRLGMALFTYDFLDAAEPALRNASALDVDEPRWPYYQGMLYRQRGAFDAAAAQFRRVLALDAEDHLARLRLAEALFESGAAREARGLAQEVIEARPDLPFAHFLLGQIDYQEGDYDAAVRHFETVVEAQPEASQVRTPLALSYRNLNDSVQSAHQLSQRGETPVHLDDPRVDTLEAFKRISGATALTRGLDRLNAGAVDEAVVLLEQATDADPHDASRHLNLGVARAYAGDRAGAIRAFERALELDPSKAKAHYNLGSLYAAEGLADEAEMHFRAAVEIDPRHAGSRLDLAELLRHDGRCAEAAPHFEAALELSPGDVAARQHFALCRLRMGEYAAARSLLEDGLAAQPDHLGYLDALARVLAAAPDGSVRDGDRALRLAEQAVALQRRTETLETLAMAHAEVGEFGVAEEYQAEAIRYAGRSGHDAYLSHLRSNLALFRDNRPARTPWPPFMYEQ